VKKLYSTGPEEEFLESGCVFTTLRFLRNLRIGPIS